MNVFTTAMSLIQSINKCQNVIIRSRVSEFNSDTGVYNEITKDVEAYAQIQMEAVSVQDMGDTATNSAHKYNLWFINLTPLVVDALLSVDVLNTEVILADGKALQIIEKEDYSYNGWIYCKGVKYANN